MQAVGSVVAGAESVVVAGLEEPKWKESPVFVPLSLTAQASCVVSELQDVGSLVAKADVVVVGME